jgi:serine phosphatase RsbU (regulator of sigma subunit)/Tfp pilus assembly protein PilF
MTSKKISIIAFLLVFTCLYSKAQNKVSSEFDPIIEKVSYHIDNFEFKEANRICDSLQTIGETSNNKHLLATIYNTKGSIYRDENKIKDAILYFNKAISTWEILKDEKGIADGYVNQGSIYSFLGEKKTALSYYFKAINIYKKQGKSSRLSVLYNNIGNIYTSTRQPINADYYFRKAIYEASKTGDSLSLARAYHNLGNSKAEVNQEDTALKYYFKSLSFLGNFNVGLGHLYNYVRLAETYSIKKNYIQSEYYLNKALPLAIEADSKEDIVAIYGILSDVYKGKGDYRKAYEFVYKRANLKDSIEKEGLHDELIKVQYETELNNQKKEQEIARQNEEAINVAKMESKNKDLLISYLGLGLAVIMGLLILNGYRQKQKANTLISKQKEIVEEKNSEILSSINYAKRIQYALLAHKEFIEKNLPEHFVYFHPKDIVSGDFYWAAKKGSRFYLGVCDSTGHGVPGAFMSLLNTGFLSEAINEKNILEPNKVLDHVRSRLIETISKEGQKDGFDGILICLDEKTNELTYAAANNAPIFISKNVLSELEKDRMPVGIGENETPFKLFTIKPEKNDVLILYTDGYADQFGGPKGKKFKYKQLNDLLLKNANMNMEEQKAELENTFQNWRGELEQVDDVCIIGIRF